MIKRITSANIIEDTCPLSHTTSLPSIHSCSHSHNNSHSDIHNQYHSHNKSHSNSHSHWHSHSHKCNSLLTCKVSDHGLEVKKRLQTTLSDFSLENSRNKWWAERRVNINGEHDCPCERSFIVKDKILSTAVCILENWFSGKDNTRVKDFIEVVGREEERREERRREGYTRVERA